MLPLLLGAGRMLAAGAARGAASGAARGAVSGGIKESIKKGVVEGAKNKAKSFIKDKITKTGKVSTDKLIPRAKKGGGGNALVRRKSSAIIRRPGANIIKLNDVSSSTETKDKNQQQEQKPFDGDELIAELTAIKETLIKIKGILGTNLKNTLKDQKNQRILKSKEKASAREAQLEKKPDAKEGRGKLELPKKKLSFFDMIWRFISNVLMGSLLNFLFNYVPNIIKMFEEISKGLENPLQQLRLGIITLTTLFPKQIKFLAKLTSKIIGPPARLIGKLLLKAGGVAKNLFKKAGSIIFNLVKGPLLNLVKRVGGEALEQGVKGAAKGTARLAGKAAGAAGSAIGSTAKILKRFKAFSKIFKRVPIVGMLIGVGIDLAMGEPLDRAIIGAAGAALGTAIGGAIGQGLIPIPIVGAAVGGFVGAGIGDWAAKKLYGDLTGRVAAVDKANPIERKASGGMLGSVKSFFGFGKSKKSTSVSSSVRKPSVKTSQVSSEVAAKAEEDVLKDEKSLNRFKSLSAIFAGTPFVGQLLRMGIDVGMGAKIDKTETDLAAQDIGYTIGKALEDGEFSVPGMNKRIIGPLTKNLTEWAKKKIFYEVKNREGLFPSIEKGEEEKKTPTSASGGPGGGDDGDTGPGPVVTGGSADFWAMAAVASLENSNPQGQADVAQVLYNRLASGKYSGKSIKALVLASGQFQPTREGNAALWAAIADKQSAIAAVNSNPNGRGRGAKMVESAAAAIQNVSLQKNAAQFVGGRTDFSATGQYRPYPGAIGIVTRHGHDIGWFVGPGSIAYGKTNPGPASAPKLGDIAVSAPVRRGGGGGGSEPPSTASLEGLPKQSKQIVFHWTGGDYNSVVGPYHTIFTGDGKKHQRIPYNQKSPGTLYRPNAINLSLAANPDKGQWPTGAQLDAMAKETAALAKNWGWSKSSINVRNVAGHGEIGSGKDVGNLSQNISSGREPSKGPAGSKDNYGPVKWGGDGSRWDLSRLTRGDDYGQGENKFRERVKKNMGGGNGFNHHALPPLAMGGHTVTSSMGLRNFALSPGMHMGVDIAGRTGEPLQAFTDGVVEATGRDGGYGNYINWIDDKGIGHFYAHMNKPAFVKRGTKVKKGTILGELGSTGRSSGPHLHWEAATNPRDTGMSKASVLTRFNPLSKYNKESPFGGNIRPDASSAEAETGTPMQPSAPDSSTQPTSTESTLSAADLAYSIKGDPAKESYLASLPPAPKGGMGGSQGTAIRRTGKLVEYLTGDPTSPNLAGKAYDPSGHGTVANYHDHVAFNERQTAIDAYKFFKSKGVKVTEFKGFDPVGGHASNSYHYSGLAFDIPGAQWGGSGAIGEKDYAGSRKVRKLLNEFFGGNVPVGNEATSGDIAQQSGSSTQPTSIEPSLSAADLAYSVKGDPAKESYLASLPPLQSSPSTSATPPPAPILPPPTPTSAIIASQQSAPSITQQSKNISSTPSYAQNGQNIIMMPSPQPQQTQSPNANGSSGPQIPPSGGVVNNTEIRSSFVRQVLASAFYKI